MAGVRLQGGPVFQVSPGRRRWGGEVCYPCIQGWQVFLNVTMLHGRLFPFNRYRWYCRSFQYCRCRALWEPGFDTTGETGR